MQTKRINHPIRNSLTILLALFFVSGIYAQESTLDNSIIETAAKKGDWRFGPVFGVSASEITEIPTVRNIPSANFEPLEQEIDYQIGMVLGGFVGYQWPSKKLGASMEVLLAQRGAKYELNATRLSDNAEINEKIEFNYNYLSMPFLLRYYPYRGLNLGVGPQFGFNLTPTNIKYESSTDGVPNDNDLNTQQLQRQWLKAKGDLGFVFALGYEFGFGLGVDVKYFLGQSDVIETQPNNGNYIEADNRSNSLSFSLLYRIPKP